MTTIFGDAHLRTLVKLNEMTAEQMFNELGWIKEEVKENDK